MLRIIFRKLKKEIELYFFKLKWRKMNKHNEIYVMSKFPIDIVEVGRYSYGPIIVKSWNSKIEKLKIGDYVSISEGVKFLLSGNHRTDTITTYPIKGKLFKESVPSLGNGEIIIEDDVWIGTDVMILSGVTVGQGAIIAARSVVTKNVEPYSIVGGNPARFIKYRFEKEMVEEMKNFNWKNTTYTTLKEKRDLFYKKLTKEVLENINSTN